MSHRTERHTESSAAELFRLVVGRLAADWRRERPSLAGSDAEAVHRMRVNLRKARNALKLFAPLLPAGLYRSANRRLRAIARRFDATRDLDVLRGEILPRLYEHIGNSNSHPVRMLQKRIDAAAIEARGLEPAGRPARRAIGPSVVAFDELMVEITGVAQRLGETRPSRPRGRKFLRWRLDALAGRAQRRLRKARKNDRPALHRLRIALKQLRDASALVQDFLPRRRRTDLALLQRATAALGELQDFERARVILTGLLREDHRLAETITLAVLQLEAWHRAAAARALRCARRAIRAR